MEAIKTKKRYKFSNGEYEEFDEKTGKIKHYAICDRCGRRCQSNAGFQISLEGAGYAMFRGPTCLCRKCSYEVIPKLFNFIQDLDDEIREYRKNSKVAEPPPLLTIPIELINALFFGPKTAQEMQENYLEGDENDEDV